MGNRHIKVISALRFLLPFAQAECSPLEVCLKGTFKTQSQTFVWLFFWLFARPPLFLRSIETKKGPFGPFVIPFCFV
ncbi:hypothetical protein AYJ56_05470 [Brucella anthropi]|nr:hypothetical protein AYJ56_05470 [Brucella anthropi]